MCFCSLEGFVSFLKVIVDFGLWFVVGGGEWKMEDGEWRMGLEQANCAPERLYGEIFESSAMIASGVRYQ